MKVISGKYKGRVLLGFNLKGTRPTQDRVKESVFATIQDKIYNSTVLDLFAGSGNLGIEAISEGAKNIYFVDYNYEAIKIINKNLNSLKIDNCNVLKKDFLKALIDFKKEGIVFDIIFLDPPYDTNCIDKALVSIYKKDLLKEDGIIVCETMKNINISNLKLFREIRRKKYGEKIVVLLKKIC